MVAIQNQEAMQTLRDEAKLSLAETPQNMQSTVVPVFDMTPRFHKICTPNAGSSGATGTVNGYAGRSRVKFFITGLQAAYVKDATCDLATGNISIACTQGGITKTILIFPVITLTAQSATESVTFNEPIEIDQGTNVTMSGSFTAGVMRRSLCVYGYEQSLD